MVGQAASGQESSSEAGGIRVGAVIARLKNGLVREARLFAFMFLYLWAVFSLFTLHEMVIVTEGEVSYASTNLRSSPFS